MKDKIIQIAVTAESENYRGVVYALSESGRLFFHVPADSEEVEWRELTMPCLEKEEVAS